MKLLSCFIFAVALCSSYAKAEDERLVFRILDKAEVAFRNTMEPVRSSLRNYYFDLQTKGSNMESDIREYTQKVLDIIRKPYEEKAERAEILGVDISKCFMEGEHLKKLVLGLQNNAFECIHRNVNETNVHVNNMDKLYFEGFERMHNLKEEAKQCSKDSTNVFGRTYCLGKLSAKATYLSGEIAARATLLTGYVAKQVLLLPVDLSICNTVSDVKALLKEAPTVSRVADECITSLLNGKPSTENSDLLSEILDSTLPSILDNLKNE